MIKAINIKEYLTLMNIQQRQKQEIGTSAIIMFCSIVTPENRPTFIGYENSNLILVQRKFGEIQLSKRLICLGKEARRGLCYPTMMMIGTSTKTGKDG